MEISRTNVSSYPVESRDQPSQPSQRNDTGTPSQVVSPARVPSPSGNGGTNAAPTSTSNSTLSRVRRGGALGKCAAASEFRECRGGEALKETAASYQKFDQADLDRKRGNTGHGACDGIVMEAIRRVDRNADGKTPDVPSAVKRILADAGRNSVTREEMFDRIERFQYDTRSLGVSRYAEGGVDRLGDTEDRTERIANLMTRIRDEMHAGDMAHVRLDRLSSGDNALRGGHAMLIARQADDRYVLFDPNNGAFVYRNRGDMEHALGGYLETAYNEADFHLTPNSIQIFTGPQPRGRPAGTPPPPPVLSEPPPAQSREGLYARTAAGANGLSQDMLSVAAETPRAMAYSGAGMAVDALMNISHGRVADLASATADLRDRLGNPLSRHATIEEIHSLQDANQYSTVANVPDHIRHDGRSTIRSAAELVDDLKRNFGSPYVRDNSLRGYDNDFVEIRLNAPADRSARVAGAQGGVPPGEAPVIVQRVEPSADYRNDAYQIYDPAVGVYSYRNFDAMSAAIRSRYEQEYAPGRHDYATTAWFANLNRSQPVQGVSQAEFAVAPESPINDITLGDIAEAHHVAVPPIALPPEPDMERLGVPRAEFRKRSTDTSDNSTQNVLFRPSTVTPEALKAQGGFSIESAPLKDVSLDMHNFDVSSNPSAVDSAGYLGTFERGGTALERLAAQSNNGYIYRVAPTPNMVDVNGSLGAGARDPQTHEQAAMGRIDYTQIVGWQHVQDGRLQPFVANPDFRWDVYDQTQTAGAQPRLARFPLTSPAWNDRSHSPFVSRISYAGKPAVPQPEQDPNRTQAEFYDHARSQVAHLVDRQARGLDYRGPMTMWGHGDARWQTKLYVGANGEVCFDYSGRVDVPGNTSQFVMGEDGRFHLANDNKRVLRVGSDGYLYAGAVPSARTNRNGVFEYDGKHLIHAEDRKFLSVGKYSYYPYVSQGSLGSRSEWSLTGFDGKVVVPPPTSLHTFWKSTAGDRFRLYEFARNPDSALPPGTTRFVTQLPGIDARNNFLDNVDKWTPKQVGKAAKWLARGNVAWLFRDGYYALASGPNQLEVRKLDSTPVWRAAIDRATRKWRWQPVGALASDYRVPDLTWDRIKADEDRNRQLQRVLKPRYTAHGQD